jgi:hypothetical protein
MEVSMRKILFPRLLRFRADDELARDLAAAARRDKLTLSEFARRELRNAIATRTIVSAGRTDDNGPGPFRPAPGLRETA